MTTELTVPPKKPDSGYKVEHLDHLEANQSGVISLNSNFHYGNEPKIRWDLDELNPFLLWAIDNKASDIVLSSGSPLWIRVFGSWMKVTNRPVITDEIEIILREITRTSTASARLQGQHDVEFHYEIKRNRFETVRFRCNASGMRCGWSVGIAITMRSIPSMPPNIADLNPEDIIMNSGFPESGLVLVTGVMGSGKTTLLAAMLRNIIENQPKQVITYEEPIEFDLMSFQNAKGFCIQTEIPTHLEKFEVAPRNSTRRAADVILVGEMRDSETMRGAIELSEIGVTVYGTLHTRSVSETPTRIINIFPADLQHRVMVTLLSSLRMIINQKLVPSTDGGRVALREMLAFDSVIRDELIKTPIHELIPKLQKYVAERGQPMIDDAKLKFEQGLISKDTMSLIRRQFI